MTLQAHRRIASYSFVLGRYLIPRNIVPTTSLQALNSVQRSRAQREILDSASTKSFPRRGELRRM